jgi:hypothetical protein
VGAEAGHGPGWRSVEDSEGLNPTLQSGLGRLVGVREVVTAASSGVDGNRRRLDKPSLSVTIERPPPSPPSPPFP